MSAIRDDGGRCRSSHLGKGKAVVYATTIPPNTDDEYDAMEAPPECPSGGAVASEGGFAEVPVGGDRVAPHRAAVTKRHRASRWIHTAPELDLNIVVPGRMYLLEGGIRPREINTVLLETWLLRDLAQHPSTFVRRYPSPSSFGRPEYPAFLESLGFGTFQSIPNMSLSHRLVRYFHHTGTFHLSTCEMGVLPFDWSAILGICFGGDDQTVVSTSILGLFKDIAMIRECDLGALTYCLYLWGLCCFSHRDTISFHDF
uniref:Aminotransferase-like plant mobile domain-containing protein n=1 Tax=Fagus sylvatica TaxID=28930 RepID=A0A2N9H115_FAGSY